MLVMGIENPAVVYIASATSATAVIINRGLNGNYQQLLMNVSFLVIFPPAFLVNIAACLEDSKRGLMMEG